MYINAWQHTKKTQRQPYDAINDGEGWEENGVAAFPLQMGTENLWDKISNWDFDGDGVRDFRLVAYLSGSNIIPLYYLW